MTKSKLSRRSFLKRGAAAGAAGVAGGSFFLGGCSRVSQAAGKKVIVIGVDGMDPRLARSMMEEGLLPNLRKLYFSELGTSTPPQSPVAWANFINGAGPGSHGIFDFMHRDPRHKANDREFIASGLGETLEGEGHWEVDNHRVPLDFWPFNHKPPTPVARRQGTPFWDFLDQAGVPSTFYDLPCNYPPSPSHHGHHRCISGMGTTDLLGTISTYQFFDEGVDETSRETGGYTFPLNFEAETARAELEGPDEAFLITSKSTPTKIEFLIHRDRDAKAAVIEIQGRRILLKEGDWSRWVKLDYSISTPWFLPTAHASGICRFYLKEVAPDLKLYVSPINIDPANPALKMSEPDSFIKEVSGQLGPFYTTGFQEDYNASKQHVFTDDEFITQAEKVLEERLALFEYAVENYDDGLLFFYFSSTDLQSHILWWQGENHPSREAPVARSNFEHIRRLYRRLDQIIGRIEQQYGSSATIMVMSDHGFANFGRQFNLNSWLRANSFLPEDCTSVTSDVDWSKAAAYGLGFNGLYLNLKGRERDGIIEPGEQADNLLRGLAASLEAVVDDETGQRVIRGVYRSSEIYQGNATAMAPDLIIGYARGYRASWETVEGTLTPEIISTNDGSWSADHCMDALEVPGVLFSNRQIRATSPSLVDIAPSILGEFRINTPASMVGKNIYTG